LREFDAQASSGEMNVVDFLRMAVAVSVVLGIMVLVHEWGHFVVAKLFGVRVEIFSIGFGTRLGGFKRGDTDYRLSALPLGGYVKMAGDNPLEERKGEPDEFLSKPRWQRVLIALAGPTMNIVLSIALVAGMYIVGSKEPAYVDKPMVLAGVLPDSTAQKAGLAAGDHVIKVNDKSNPTWDDAQGELVSMLPGHSLSMVVERGGQQLPIAIPMGQSIEDMFGYPFDRLVVDSVTAGMPADKGGMKKGDLIVKVNGKPLNNPQQFPGLVQVAQGAPINLEVLRGDQTVQLTVQPTRVGVKNGLPYWQVGIGIKGGDLVDRRLPVGTAILASTNTNLLMARQVVYVVAELFERRLSLQQLVGPLGIAKASGDAAKEGPGSVIRLMAMIGVNLAVLNLLPIPPLDGGHILLLFIEGTIQRDLSVRVKERFVTVSMLFLLLVFAIVMYNDVLRLIPHH
jgi:regulator of sigma E protease